MIAIVFCIVCFTAAFLLTAHVAMCLNNEGRPTASNITAVLAACLLLFGVYTTVLVVKAEVHAIKVSIALSAHGFRRVL